MEMTLGETHNHLQVAATAREKIQTWINEV